MSVMLAEERIWRDFCARWGIDADRLGWEAFRFRAAQPCSCPRAWPCTNPKHPRAEWVEVTS